MSVAGDAVAIALAGLSYGMILVLAAAGLSLIFGLMGVLNFAHGALFALGAYVGLTVMKAAGGGIGGFLAALIVAPIVIAVIGFVLERTVYKPLYETDTLYQLLLTFGIAVVIEEIIQIIWGPSAPAVPPLPAVFDGQLALAGISLPYYRAFIILVGALVVLGLGAFLKYTRYGLIVRAGVYDAEKTNVLGLNVDRAFTLVFGIGAAIAAVGGVVYIYRSVSPGLGSSIILQAFIVVIIGGLGSFKGTVVAGLLVGVIWQFAAQYAPIPSGTVIFLVMLAVLIARPQGLLGEAEVEV
jgi:branched-chain amino acid transport system permease protein